MNQLQHHHQLDRRLAALDNHEIEILWRNAVARKDADDLEPLARQLVLRALPAIESACRMRGARAAMTEADIDAACREASIKLMLRLLHDTSWRSLTALASQLAGEVVSDPRRRRRGTGDLFLTARPKLRLLPGAGVDRHGGGAA
jgi:hypothetical protein